MTKKYICCNFQGMNDEDVTQFLAHLPRKLLQNHFSRLFVKKIKIQLKTRENSTLTSPPGCEWNLHYTHFVVNSLLSTLCFLFSSTFWFCLFFLLLCGLCSVEWGNDKVFLFFFALFLHTPRLHLIGPQQSEVGVNIIF